MMDHFSTQMAAFGSRLLKQQAGHSFLPHWQGMRAISRAKQEWQRGLQVSWSTFWFQPQLGQMQSQSFLLLTLQSSQSLTLQLRQYLMKMVGMVMVGFSHSKHLQKHSPTIFSCSTQISFWQALHLQFLGLSQGRQLGMTVSDLHSGQMSRYSLLQIFWPFRNFWMRLVGMKEMSFLGLSTHQKQQWLQLQKIALNQDTFLQQQVHDTQSGKRTECFILVCVNSFFFTWT